MADPSRRMYLRRADVDCILGLPCLLKPIRPTLGALSSSSQCSSLISSSIDSSGLSSSSGGGDTGVMGGSSVSSAEAFADPRVTLPLLFPPLPEPVVVVVLFDVVSFAAAAAARLFRAAVLSFSAFARRSPRRAGGWCSLCSHSLRHWGRL